MIRINDDYVINADDLCFAFQQDLHTTHEDKNGNVKPNYKTIGYYTTLHKALQGARDFFIRKSISESEMTIGDACERCERITKDFERMMNNE